MSWLPLPIDVHAGDQRGDRDHGSRERPSPQRAERVAGDDAAAPRGAEHQPPGEAGIEVAGDREPGEDAAEGRRLQKDEDELERGVAGRIVEVRHVADARETAREGDEEEQREDDRRHEDRRVDERVVDRAPGDAAGDVEEAPHVRVNRDFMAICENPSVTTSRASAKPNPSASAWASQPVMTRLRSASSR